MQNDCKCDGRSVLAAYFILSTYLVILYTLVITATPSAIAEIDKETLQYSSAVISSSPSSPSSSASSSSLKQSFTIESLFIALFSNGDASVQYDLSLDKAPVQKNNIKLIGKTINDLIVSDYFDNPLERRLKEETGEVSINSSGLTSLYVSYSTPDLVDKEDRVWTFSIDSPVLFSLKMPSDTQIIKLGGDNTTSSVRRISQDLLTFSPGITQVSYVIGPIGSDAEADAVIKSAEVSIQDAEVAYPEINLTASRNLVQEATISKFNGQYMDASTYGIEANNIVRRTVENYRSAQDAISQAELQLEKLATKDGGKNTNHFKSLVDKAYALFSIGKYYESKLSADAVMLQGNLDAPPLEDAAVEASALYNNDPANTSTDNIFVARYKGDGIFLVIFAVLLVLVIALAASLGVLLFRLKAKRSTNLLTNLASKLKLNIIKRKPEHLEGSDRGRVPSSLPPHRKSSQANSIFSNSSFLSNSQNHELPQSPKATKSALLPAASSIQTTESPLPLSSSTPVNKTNITTTSTPSKVAEQAKEEKGGEEGGGSQRYSLKKKILRFISERQNLRPEEKALLEFLANRQGAAFESELRNKLLLPKTSVWRLIRRLEREEILEVIRLGSQNLIKIKPESIDS